MSMKNNSVRRAERREQAAIRKAEKIVRAKSRRGESKKELRRLGCDV